MTPEDKYPALMAYIKERSSKDEKTAWNILRSDEAAAVQGDYGDVAQELENAQADYAAAQIAKGGSGYPYNSEMGIFLGLPLRSNHEPPRGYYFANQVMKHFQLGAAKREVESLLANGAHLKIVAARDKASGRPIRFTTYKPHQIQIEGNSVVCRNDKRSVRLSSNWSTETALQKVAEALRTGQHYGYDAALDDRPTPAPPNGRGVTDCAPTMKRWPPAGHCEAVAIAAFEAAFNLNNNCDLRHNLAGNRAYPGRARITRGCE